MLRWELRHRRTPRSWLRAGSIASAPPRAPRPEAPPLEGSPSAILLGVLPPVAGAFFQEAIDVAVILNALRALGGGELGKPGPGEMATEENIPREDVELMPQVERD